MAGDPDDDDARTSEGGVVDPQELDIEDDEHVQSLGDNRYVVSAEERTAHANEPKPTTETTEQTSDSETTTDDTEKLEGDSVDVHRARARLTERMSETSGAYGFDITAQFGDEVIQQHLQANDIVTVFDALLLWYAEHLDDETPPEEAIGILLAESDIPVEYPADVLITLAKAHGLDGDDTIADLFGAVSDGTVQFPPQ